MTSFEGFLEAQELDTLRSSLRDVLADIDRGAHSERDRGSSVHVIDGYSLTETMTIFEPAGRAETTALPDEAAKLLALASERAVPRLRRFLPSARTVSDWILVSYGVGQYITPHIDLAHNDDDPNHPKLAGIGVPLTPADEYEGGEFFVETTASPSIWAGEHNGVPYTRPDCDESAEWFRSLRRTRWQARAQAGDALLYGSQLTHGTTPVTAGRVTKVIGFVLA
ncbi:phytanoyl-CoA dioxygenase family protein [Virgisporangium ochraceum]|uniref:phytanoyl-CoA dioxygenase family protein n=1 Tax=Virgisporangium ochraceum TaxID=65505 RepID=UPI0019452C3A|nr:phytanoyl-CoA dioxygenase family protein [Virgisporangium ochraceum]